MECPQPALSLLSLMAMKEHLLGKALEVIKGDCFFPEASWATFQGLTDLLWSHRLGTSVQKKQDRISTLWLSPEG